MFHVGIPDANIGWLGVTVEKLSVRNFALFKINTWFSGQPRGAESMGPLQHQVDPIRGRRCDPEVAGWSRVMGETECDYPVGWLGKGEYTLPILFGRDSQTQAGLGSLHVEVSTSPTCFPV